MDAHRNVMTFAPFSCSLLIRLPIGQEGHLGPQMDPLRKLMRKRKESLNVTLRHMRQFEALRRGRDCGPISDYGV